MKGEVKMEVIAAGIVALIIGLVIGFILGVNRVRDQYEQSLSGSLMIDCRDSSSRPDMYLSDCSDPADILKNPYATFKVIKINQISQK
jgi:hypothetical protein